MNRVQPDTSLPREPAIKVYAALISQTGTNAPTLTTLENTIGNITSTYSYVGGYTLASNGLFTNNKTTVIITGDTGGCIFTAGPISEDEITIIVGEYIAGTFETENDILNGSIEIKVYK